MLFSPGGMDQKLSTSLRLRVFKCSSPIEGSEVIFVPFKNLKRNGRELFRINERFSTSNIMRMFPENMTFPPYDSAVVS